MKKNRTEKKSGGLTVIGFVLIVLIALAIVWGTKEKPPVSTQKTQDVPVVWTSTNLSQVYPSGSTTEDIVSDTYKAWSQLYAFVTHEIASDTHLIRLFEKEQAVAVTKEQMDIDLRKLSGLKLDFIGQYHEGIGSDALFVRNIQSHIAHLVRNYDVMWAEDFTGGGIITFESGCKLLAEESEESDLPTIRGFNHYEDTKARMKQDIPQYASFQFIFDPSSTVEVRGADYRPVKMIQQHLMGYELPLQFRGKPVPYVLNGAQKQLITGTLSNMRNLYILRYIALNASRDKRNVLVLGAGHINHMSYLMAKYGVTSTIHMPEVRH